MACFCANVASFRDGLAHAGKACLSAKDADGYRIGVLHRRGHFLGRTDRVLKMSSVRDLTAAYYVDGMGRPSIDREVCLRMLLVTHLRNITPDRHLREKCPRPALCLAWAFEFGPRWGGGKRAGGTRRRYVTHSTQRRRCISLPRPRRGFSFGKKRLLALLSGHLWPARQRTTAAWRLWPAPARVRGTVDHFVP
jgi:hypothetical protein